MGWSCKRWKAKLRWKSSVAFFLAPRKKQYLSRYCKWIVRCFLQHIFMDVILDLENVWGVKWLPIVTGYIHVFCCCFWLKTLWKTTWVGVVFLFILSFDWVFFHRFALDFSVSGWFLKDFFSNFHRESLEGTWPNLKSIFCQMGLKHQLMIWTLKWHFI